jgi:hypothetical protein
MKKWFIAMLLVALPVIAAAQDRQGQPLVTLSEDVWVTFYDLPSRRFRSIRDAFVRRDFDSVSRDLGTTIGFLTVEADRAVPELKPALEEVLAQFVSIRERLPDTAVSVGQLDTAFARTHWLLAQHYFVRAMQARELAAHRNAGANLIATTHHLERAVLWSDARITRKVVKSLDSVRDMASKLLDGESPERVYRNRPLRLMGETITEVGQQLDRRVRIEGLIPK